MELGAGWILGTSEKLLCLILSLCVLKIVINQP